MTSTNATTSELAAGSVIVGPDEQNADVLVGLAVGDGLLVVPAGNTLAAFGG